MTFYHRQQRRRGTGFTLLLCEANVNFEKSFNHHPPTWLTRLKAASCTKAFLPSSSCSILTLTHHKAPRHQQHAGLVYCVAGILVLDWALQSCLFSAVALSDLCGIASGRERLSVRLFKEGINRQGHLTSARLREKFLTTLWVWLQNFEGSPSWVATCVNSTQCDSQMCCDTAVNKPQM